MLDGESFPSLCSEVEQESMKVWATTDRQASVMLFLWMSNTNWGFLITFTQNLRGRLGEGGWREGGREKRRVEWKEGGRQREHD